MNEPLRRALLRARLREDDIAARLGVDPKTVRRWLTGRVPYPHNRAAIAELVGADEADLWPDAGGLLAARTRPEELGTVYPHRWAVPREAWVRLFESAERDIAVLAYSALFLAEDAGILDPRVCDGLHAPMTREPAKCCTLTSSPTPRCRGRGRRSAGAFAGGPL